MLVFRDKVNLGSILAFSHVVAISVNALAAIVGIIDLLRFRPSSRVGCVWHYRPASHQAERIPG